MPDNHHNLPPDDNLSFLNAEGRAEMKRRWDKDIASGGDGSVERLAKQHQAIHTMRTLGEKALTDPIDKVIESVKARPKRERPPGKTNYSRGRGLGPRRGK